MYVKSLKVKCQNACTDADDNKFYEILKTSLRLFSRNDCTGRCEVNCKNALDNFGKEMILLYCWTEISQT